MRLETIDAKVAELATAPKWIGRAGDLSAEHGTSVSAEMRIIDKLAREIRRDAKVSREISGLAAYRILSEI